MSGDAKGLLILKENLVTVLGVALAKGKGCLAVYVAGAIIARIVYAG